MESALRIKKPHQGKNLHPRRRHQGKQSVSRGRRWGKSNRSYDGTSGVPEFKNGALTGAFSRLFNDVATDKRILLKVHDEFSNTQISKALKNEAKRFDNMFNSDFTEEMAPDGFVDLGTATTSLARLGLADKLREIVIDKVLINNNIESINSPPSLKNPLVAKEVFGLFRTAADVNFTYSCKTICDLVRINVKFPD